MTLEGRGSDATRTSLDESPTRLFRELARSVMMARENLLIEVVQHDGDMDVAVRFHDRVTPAPETLVDAARQLVPHILACEIPDYDRGISYSGEMTLTSRGNVFMNVEDHDEGWSYRKLVDTTRIPFIDMQASLSGIMAGLQEAMTARGRDLIVNFSKEDGLGTYDMEWDMGHQSPGAVTADVRFGAARLAEALMAGEIDDFETVDRMRVAMTFGREDGFSMSALDVDRKRVYERKIDIDALETMAFDVREMEEDPQPGF